VRAFVHPARSLLAAIMTGYSATIVALPARADMIDMTGVQPWDLCGGCHGLDGAGNRIKFPRLAGQSAAYLIKQLNDFRDGRRQNDGGQMQQMASELTDDDIRRIAEWFAKQTPPWPEPTIEPAPDVARARQLATAGADGIPACTSCHSAAAPAMTGRGFATPRLAGQRDYYIAKQLTDFRDGERDNDPNEIMRSIAKRLTDADIAGLAAFLSKSPELHEAPP
jgi:cytochrome c553